MGRNITTLGQATNTQPQVTSVTSATGFQAGDLVYNLNGSYGPISDTAVATATFPINATRPYAVGNGILSGNVEVVESNNVGSQFGKSADKLTNGNTVIVWMQGTYTGRTSGGVYFKIINNAGAQVVAPTLVSTATAGYELWAMMSVVALTGGGFAIAWMGSSNTLYTVTYDNAGVQTGAPTTRGVMNTTYSMLSTTATTNGGFAVAYWNNSTTTRLDTYSSTNTAIQTGLATSIAGTLNTYYAIGLAARQNGAVHEVLIVHMNNGSTYKLTTFNVVTGASIYTDNFSVAAGTVACDASVNTTNNSFIIAYIDSTSLILRDLTTSNANTVNISAGSSMYPSIAIKGLSSGKIIIISATNRYSPGVFTFTDTYTQINATRTEINNIASPYWGGNAIIDNGDGTVFVYQSAPANGVANTDYSKVYVGTMAFIFKYKVDVNTALQIPANSTYAVTATVGNTGTINVSGYIRNASTPALASFYAAATSTQSVTQAASSGTTNFVTAQQTIEAVACDSMDSDTLANGNIVFAYRYAGSPYTVKYAIYTPTGTLVTSGTAGTGISTNDQMQSAYVAALPNGKFGVFFYSASSTVAYRIYSAAGDLLVSGNVSFGGFASFSVNTRYINVAGLTSNRFAIIYCNGSGYPNYLVMDDTGVNIATDTLDGIAMENLAIAALPNGGFAAWAYRNGYYYYVYKYVQSGANTYTLANNRNGIGASSATLVSNTIVGSPDGTIYAYIPVNGSVTAFNSYSVDLQRENLSSNIGGCNSGTAYAGMGITGSGMVVAYNQTSTEQYIVTYGPRTFQNTTVTMSVWTSTGLSCPTIAAGSGDNFVLGVLNSSRFPSFAILNSLSNTFSATITAGVTASNPTTISPFTTGHYMTGVSVTSCSAGGSGIVQTNGAAQLNTNYSASTAGQYFDFDVNPAVPGVKGSISGRTVTMTRN